MKVDGFQQLVEQHQHRVFTFAAYFLGDHAEAEDITQEVLLRLWHHVDDVEPERAGAWLAQVTRNVCYDTLRQRRSRGKLIEEDSSGERITTATDPLSRSEAGAEAWDVQRHLESALQRLDEPYRSVVVLREIQDLKYQEISETLKMPLNTVKTYLHRGRRKLREMLEEVHCYARTS